MASITLIDNITDDQSPLVENDYIVTLLLDEQRDIQAVSIKRTIDQMEFTILICEFTKYGFKPFFANILNDPKFDVLRGGNNIVSKDIQFLAAFYHKIIEKEMSVEDLIGDKTMYYQVYNCSCEEAFAIRFGSNDWEIEANDPVSNLG